MERRRMGMEGCGVSGVDVTQRMWRWRVGDGTLMPLNKLSFKPLKLISPPCLLPLRHAITVHGVHYLQEAAA